MRGLDYLFVLDITEMSRVDIFKTERKKKKAEEYLAPKLRSTLDISVS